jgi:hypothetical protein
MQTTNEKLDETSGTLKLGKSRKVIRDQKQWLAIFEAHRASGLTVEQFCRTNQISRSGFWKWSKQLGAPKAVHVDKAIEPSFLAIPIKAEPSRCSLELELGTMRVRLDGPAMERVIDAIIKRITIPA